MHTYMLPSSSQFNYLFQMLSLSYLMSYLCLGYVCEQILELLQPIALALGRVGSPNYYSVFYIFSIKCCSTINWFIFRNSNCMCSNLTHFGQVTGSDNMFLLTVPDAVSGLRSLLEHS